jgi:hypothetical protein
MQYLEEKKNTTPSHPHVHNNMKENNSDSLHLAENRLPNRLPAKVQQKTTTLAPLTSNNCSKEDGTNQSNTLCEVAKMLIYLLQKWTMSLK